METVEQLENRIATKFILYNFFKYMHALNDCLRGQIIKDMLLWQTSYSKNSLDAHFIISLHTFNKYINQPFVDNNNLYELSNYCNLLECQDFIKFLKTIMNN